MSLSDRRYFESELKLLQEDINKLSSKLFIPLSVTQKPHKQGLNSLFLSLSSFSLSLSILSPSPHLFNWFQEQIVKRNGYESDTVDQVSE